MHTLWLSINIQSYPVTYDLDLQSQASYGYDSYTNKNSFSKVNQFKRWKETDGRTDGRMLLIALSSRLITSVKIQNTNKKTPDNKHNPS